MSEGEIILTATAVSKRYQRRDGNTRTGTVDFYALHEVGFHLHKGDILGIIGRNGSGKTTLLKILSEIVSPTEGTIEYDGRITSVIDIGVGFHPDLSGYENIFLNGSLIGLSKQQIETKKEQIIDFSGIREFIHSPVKQYSSGMYLRLAFSIAIHAEADILLLDEVIGVGDVEFRRQCYTKVKELAAKGTAIILVSHNMTQVMEFCNRVIWIDKGNVQAGGNPVDVVEAYMRSVLGNNTSSAESGQLKNIFQDDFFAVHEMMISGKGAKTTEIYTGDPIHIAFDVEKMQEEDAVELTFYLTGIQGNWVLLDSYALNDAYRFDTVRKKGRYRIECIIPGDLLVRGAYSVSLIISRSDMIIAELENISYFKIYPKNGSRRDAHFNRSNLPVQPVLDWKIEYLSS